MAPQIDYAIVPFPDGTGLMIWVWQGNVRTLVVSDYDVEPRSAILRDLSKPLEES